MRRFIVKKKQERKTKFINKPSLKGNVEITNKNNIENKKIEENNIKYLMIYLIYLFYYNKYKSYFY